MARASHANPVDCDTWFGWTWGVPTADPDTVVTVIFSDGKMKSGRTDSFDWNLLPGSPTKIDYWHFGEVVW